MEDDGEVKGENSMKEGIGNRKRKHRSVGERSRKECRSDFAHRWKMLFDC